MGPGRKNVDRKEDLRTGDVREKDIMKEDVMKKDIGDVAVAGKEAAIDGRISPPAARTQAAGYNRAERGLASSMGRLAALPRGCCQRKKRAGRRGWSRGCCQRKKRAGERTAVSAARGRDARSGWA